MKPPKTLIINGNKWKWKLVNQALCSEGKPVDGTADLSTKILEVSKDLDMELEYLMPVELSRVFYHEALHACFQEHGLEDQSWWDMDKEHQIISALQGFLAQNFTLDL